MIASLIGLFIILVLGSIFLTKEDDEWFLAVMSFCYSVVLLIGFSLLVLGFIQ